MKPGIALLWMATLIVMMICVLFPPRRDTEQGHDRENVLPREFLWSSELYQGSPTSVGNLVARIDLEKLALELLLTAAASGAITIAGVFMAKTEAEESKAG